MALNNSVNRYSVGAGFTVDVNGFGDYTTISSAMTAAVSGKTIFIRPGTYTENITLKAGVDLTAFDSESSVNSSSAVIIKGTCTMNVAGSCTISGLQLQTNSANVVTVSGTLASIVNLRNCYINCTNNTGISLGSSSASSQINIFSCEGDLGTTAISLFDGAGTGTINLNYCNITNSGGSQQYTTLSAGTYNINYCELKIPLQTTSTATANIAYTYIDTSAQNKICFNHTASTTATINFGSLSSGSAAASNIGTGATLTITACAVNSSAANVFTGAGTLFQQGIMYLGTVSISTSTVTGGLLFGSVNKAPSTFMTGQTLTSSVSAVATTSTTPKNLTSVSLTAGVWDISGLASAVATGGAAVMSDMQLGISATTGTISGTLGQQYAEQKTAASAVLTCEVPVFRVVLTATTSYFLVIQNTYTSTTCPTNGRISATRVG